MRPINIWPCIAVLALFIGVASADEPASSRILGKWIGRAPNGDRVSYEFKKDGQVIWTVDAPNFPGSVTARYAIDDSTKPIQLNIFEFSFAPLREHQFLGILEFQAADRMRLDGRPLRAGERGARLQQFTREAIVFSKSR